MKDEEILENLNWMKDARFRPDELQMVVDQIAHHINHEKNISIESTVMLTQRIIETHLYTKVLHAAMPQARTYEREKVLKEVFETWKCEAFVDGQLSGDCNFCNRCKMRIKLVGI